MKKKPAKEHFLEKLSTKVASLAGTSGAFVLAFSSIIVWLITGPLFDYSNTWQLVINTGTTIVTFLMVFLIQRSQNKDSIALNLKLNELLASNEHASNRLVSVEDLTEEELNVLRKFYANIAHLASKEKSMQETHSIEEAMALNKKKSKKKASAAQ
ncbi:MAG: low affinity iron permease family protein [Cyclobacteriaceae bacterium]|nr:low affinity iron permease family protein [Cyclobacteriaceae bacterium]